MAGHNRRFDGHEHARDARGHGIDIGHRQRDGSRRACLHREGCESVRPGEAILFGSRARKAYRPDSVADVAVLLHGRPGKFVATKVAMADLAYDVLLATGIRIQPLPIWEDEWAHPETYSNPRLLRNIEREGIRL